MYILYIFSKNNTAKMKKGMKFHFYLLLLIYFQIIFQ